MMTTVQSGRNVSASLHNGAVSSRDMQQAAQSEREEGKTEESEAQRIQRGTDRELMDAKEQTSDSDRKVC